MSTIDPGFTDQQIRSIASALRARGKYDEPERADELDAAVALEWLYRERGDLTARLDAVTRAVHDVTHDSDGGEVDGDLPAEEVRRVLYEALNGVAW
jgi:single-stranded DNA-specific DHH superfamily exonuclease